MSDKSRADIIDKLEKLMRRTKENGCSEAEIEQAIAFARRLMDKHNIEMSEVLSASNKELNINEITEECVRTHSKTDRHEISILHTVCNVCDVKAYFIKDRILNKNMKFKDQYKFMVFGFPNDVLAAKILYSELLIASLAMTRHRLGTGWSLQHKYYCNGFCAGLYQKSKDLKQNAGQGSTNQSACTALIRIKDQLIRQYEDGLNAKTRRSGRAPKAGENGEYYQGLNDGKSYEYGVDRHSKLPQEQKRLN